VKNTGDVSAPRRFPKRLRRFACAHVRGCWVIEYLHGATCDSEIYFRRANSHRAERCYRDERVGAFRRAAGPAADRTNRACAGSIALARARALAVCSVCAGVRVGLGGKTPATAWDAIRANRRVGDSAFDRPGGVLRLRHWHNYAGGNANGNLHHDGHRNIYRRRRQHNAHRRGDSDCPVALDRQGRVTRAQIRKP
jgi:hypothetical protein